MAYTVSDNCGAAAPRVSCDICLCLSLINLCRYQRDRLSSRFSRERHAAVSIFTFFCRSTRDKSMPTVICELLKPVEAEEPFTLALNANSSWWSGVVFALWAWIPVTSVLTCFGKMIFFDSYQKGRRLMLSVSIVLSILSVSPVKWEQTNVGQVFCYWFCLFPGSTLLYKLL